jgi:hypothetical protein
MISVKCKNADYWNQKDEASYSHYTKSLLSRIDGEARGKSFYRRFLIDGKFKSFYEVQNINWDQRFALDVL